MAISKKRIITPLLLVFLFSSELFSQKKNETTLKVADFGFKITRPVDDWKTTQTNPDPTSLMVKVSLEKAGGAVEVTVIASPSNGQENEAQDERDAVFGRTNDNEKYSMRRKKDFVIDGRAAPGIQLDWDIAGGTYRVQQCYICNQQYRYTIAIHSPADQFESDFETLDDIRKSVRFVPISGKALREATINRIAAKCGSEVDWASNWKEASQRAEEENKAILVLVRSQPGFDIADGVTTIALMDENIIGLLNQHCVVLRFNKGDSAPIVDYDKYGIGPASFGNTVLLSEPDGTVFGDTFSYEPNTFYDFLTTSLADRIKNGQPPESLDNQLAVAEWYSVRGDLDSAFERLQGLNDPVAHQLRASLYLRQRKADKAIQELKLAAEKTKDEKLAYELKFDETMIGLYSAKLSTAHALAAFEDIIQHLDNHPRKPEIAYWVGICQFAESRKDEAEKTWNELINTFGETNRWAWKAAASLKSTAFKMDIVPEFGWPNDEVIAAFRSIPFETKAASIDDFQSEAIQYLLKGQRQDGSWISPPDALQAKGYNTSPFTVAITSICANSLLAHREDPEIAKRIERAVEFLVQSHDAAKADPPKAYYMDYSPWADAYLLRFLAQYVEDYPRQADRIRPLVDDTVKQLATKQKPGGGWSYYITHNLRQANRPSNQSISFMTAAVVVALLETRDAGFEVPGEMTKSAVDCLVRMRNSNPTFTYFLWHENESAGRNLEEEGSAGRGPLCAFALAKAGQGEPGEVKTCLDLFMKFKDLYSRERGKSLMHAAPGGQGSHYLMFDYCWAAEAAASLPAEQKAIYRKQLLDLLNRSRSSKGSYLDNPINGWHYGTAMALNALNVLQ